MPLPNILTPGASFSVGGGIGVGTLVAHVVADIRGFTTGLSKATRHLKGFSVKIDTFLKKNATVMRRLGMRAAIVGAAVVAGVGAMVKSYGEFERRMRRATAVSEVSEAQFLEMSRMAEAASVKLNIAATNAADAFYFLGSAGLTASEQMEAFPAVALMSKAAVIDLKFSAEMMVDTIKAYQRSFKDTTEITNIFTEAVTSSNMTFSHLGETLALVAAIGRRTNNSIADLTAMIGLMANTGIKGSRAGTSLRRALLNLAAPSNEVRVELAKWGVTIYDTEKRMKPLIQIIGEFGEVLKDATDEQKNLAFKTMFGVRAITGQLAIFDLGIEKVQAYSDRINTAGDASERVARKQMKAFMEQVGRVGQEVKRLARHIGTSLAPAISDLADKLKPMIEGMTKWIDTNEEIVVAIMATVTSMGVMLLVGGTLTMGLAGLAIAAAGLGVTVLGLGVAITAVTLGIGALVGTVVYAIVKIMKFRKEVELLKKEMKFDKPLGELEKLMTKLKPLMDAQIKDADKAFGLLYKNWGRLKDLEEDMGKALDATRSELLEMARQYKLQEPSMLILTRALRSSVLRELVILRDMYSKMAELNIETVERMLSRTEKAIRESTRKQMTTFEVAYEERLRDRTDEFRDWEIKTSAWADYWNEMEYERIQATKDALDTMEDATSDFFTNMIVEAENWKDHIISFLKDIQRAIARMYAEMIAKQIMATSITKSIAGALLPGLAGVAPLETISPRVYTPAERQAGFGGGPGVTTGITSRDLLESISRPLQSGGIIGKPTIGLLGERGAEAVVPLSGGRSIPVEMSGSPSVEVNVINQTSRPVSAKRGPVRFDGKKLVTEVILQDSVGYGPLKSAGIIG